MQTNIRNTSVRCEITLVLNQRLFNKAVSAVRFQDFESEAQPEKSWQKGVCPC